MAGIYRTIFLDHVASTTEVPLGNASLLHAGRGCSKQDDDAFLNISKTRSIKCGGHHQINLKHLQHLPTATSFAAPDFNTDEDGEERTNGQQNGIPLDDEAMRVRREQLPDGPLASRPGPEEENALGHVFQAVRKKYLVSDPETLSKRGRFLTEDPDTGNRMEVPDGEDVIFAVPKPDMANPNDHNDGGGAGDHEFVAGVPGGPDNQDVGKQLGATKTADGMDVPAERNPYGLAGGAAGDGQIIAENKKGTSEPQFVEAPPVAEDEPEQQEDAEEDVASDDNMEEHQVGGTDTALGANTTSTTTGQQAGKDGGAEALGTAQNKSSSDSSSFLYSSSSAESKSLFGAEDESYEEDHDELLVRGRAGLRLGDDDDEKYGAVDNDDPEDIGELREFSSPEADEDVDELREIDAAVRMREMVTGDETSTLLSSLPAASSSATASTSVPRSSLFPKKAVFFTELGRENYYEKEIFNVAKKCKRARRPDDKIAVHDDDLRKNPTTCQKSTTRGHFVHHFVTSFLAGGSKWVTAKASPETAKSVSNSMSKFGNDTLWEANERRRQTCEDGAPTVYMPFFKIPFGYSKRGFRDGHYFDRGRKRFNGVLRYGDGYGCPAPKPKQAKKVPGWVLHEIAQDFFMT
ncbi:unnamed protein product [Amoebophrya sp. A120]|nr:unnamed protein product [Amoebophrya sp. A120]|eukprot:GSA120T00024923001.1